MGYSGENQYFRFSDGCCESLPDCEISSAEAASAGNRFAANFKRLSIGCDSFSHIHQVYALCSGISEAGKDAYIWENTDLPSFLFGFPILSSDCGIFVSGNGCLRLKIFNAEGTLLDSEKVAGIMNTKTKAKSDKCGKIISAASFRDIYICNLRQAVENSSALNASVSCGSSSVRSLWNEFFSGDCDDLVFQISSDGMAVNAYSTKFGHIPMEKLQAAYAAVFSENALLPDKARVYDISSADKSSMISELPMPRFLKDPLYMCIRLVSERDRFFDALKALPEVTSIKRDIIVSFDDALPFRKTLRSGKSSVFLDRSGRNRISLLVQSLSAETASELTAFWTERLGSAKNIKDVII